MLTLNQRVQGSSPCAPTNKIRHFCNLGKVTKIAVRTTMRTILENAAVHNLSRPAADAHAVSRLVQS